MEDTVFDSAQIPIHLAEQIQLLLKLYQRIDDHSILVMANPDIPRIRQQAEIVSKALNHLLIIQFWVQLNGSVQLLFPNILSAQIQLLGLQN